MVKWVSTKKRLPEYDNHYCVLAKHEYKVVFYNPYHNKWFEFGTEIEVDYWLDDFAWHEMMDKNDWDEDWDEQDEIDCLKSEIQGYRMALGECRKENERLKLNDHPNAVGEGSVGKKNINTNDLQPKEDNQQVLHEAHVSRRFSYDAEGYSAAQLWLKEIGEWERVSKSGFSTDGWSIVETANVIWEKRNGG